MPGRPGPGPDPPSYEFCDLFGVRGGAGWDAADPVVSYPTPTPFSLLQRTHPPIPSARADKTP